MLVFCERKFIVFPANTQVEASTFVFLPLGGQTERVK